MTEHDVIEPELHYAEEGPGQWLATLDWNNRCVDAWGPTKEHAVGLAFQKLGRYLLEEARHHTTHPAPPPVSERTPRLVIPKAPNVPTLDTTPLEEADDEVLALLHAIPTSEEHVREEELNQASALVLERYFDAALEPEMIVDTMHVQGRIRVIVTKEPIGKERTSRTFWVDADMNGIEEAESLINERLD